MTMKYVYDVWVNWFEGEEEGYNVCEYHEWRSTDRIDILEQVPYIYITKDFYDYIENSLHELPDTFLEKIHKRAYIRKGASRRVLEYACIITNGEKVMAMNTLGYHIPLQKSRLIPRQERQVLEYCAKERAIHFSFPSYTEHDSIQLLKLKEHQVIGLTRRERQLKKLLLIALDQLKLTDNRNELLYWLTEWDKNLYQNLPNDITIAEMWNLIYEAVLVGWSESHERLCEQMIKGNAFLEKFWEIENKYNENPSHKH